MSIGGAAEEVSIDVDVRDGRTVITVTGTRDAAVIVRSAGGEEIYLPPENFTEYLDEDAPHQDTPYETASPGESPYDSGPGESPYQGLTGSDSPYESGREPSREGGTDAEGRESAAPVLGTHPTANGFRIVHPEPVRDLRLVR